jgi:uncharacterized spore protein YtfJ
MSEELMIGTAVRVGDATVVPLVVQRKGSGYGSSGFWYGAERFPVAVLIRRAAAVSAFSVGGQEHDAEALISALPELAVALGLTRAERD